MAVLNSLPGWEPAIYEHKAALIGVSPGELIASEDLLVRALIAEHETYHADALTVGVDIYNVEAEALGARLTEATDTGCPEVVAPLWTLDSLPARLSVPELSEHGRFRMMLDVAQRVKETVCSATGAPRVRVAASGPLSIATKLVGTEEVLIGLIGEHGELRRLLDFATDYAAAWLTAIVDRGLEAVVFDSAASPPLISPALYGETIAPRHRMLMSLLASAGQRVRPLVIGGDTVGIVADLIGTGATNIVCDYAAGAGAFIDEVVRASTDSPITVRRNIDPTALAGETHERVIDGFVDDLVAFASQRIPVIIGTGILPYSQNPEHVNAFRDRVTERYAAAVHGTR
ncbi:MAG: hypothetical protein EA382_02075 [Spirochaetaceae bacterium]|nr:MAG: hypothetical protein EA382_02075 [Spirochaetaceae bacterium]